MVKKSAKHVADGGSALGPPAPSQDRDRSIRTVLRACGRHPFAISVSVLIIMLGAIFLFLLFRVDNDPINAQMSSLPVGAMSEYTDPDGVSGFSAVDEAIQRLQLSNVVYNVPRELQLGQRAEIEVAVGLGQTIEQLKRAISASGELESGQARVSPLVTANLHGEGFEIVALSPETQAVSTFQQTRWKWVIKPTEGGLQRVHLTISANVQLQGATGSLGVQTFSRFIEVRVSPWQSLTTLVEGKGLVTSSIAGAITALIVFLVPKMRMAFFKLLTIPLGRKKLTRNPCGKVAEQPPTPQAIQTRERKPRRPISDSGRHDSGRVSPSPPPSPPPSKAE